ncbi:MAG TPA: ectonucleotide pyrophosphatase/phosphodiesterase, partial [Gemmatimonadales bacterium]|nr:ectonucleotide pyrophosphatase/phosphodiesterase [Gemmatimonadales bacterium]
MRAFVLVLLGLVGCGGRARPPVVLVSLDGFRQEYFDRGLTPALAALARDGVRARALVPVFPTTTFPNHYAIVTGLYPGRHGIVGNEFTAPDVGARFAMRDRGAVRDARFWLGMPVWVAAERHGLRTAPYFWPGSEAPIDGIRPTWWMPYDHATPDTARVRRVLDWLALPEGRRPALVTLYFSLVDHAGHDFGPDAPETDSAIARADHLVALLRAGLDRLGRSTNLLVVSDHGMTAVSPERVVWLDGFVPREWLEIDGRSPVLTGWPLPGREDSVVQ